MRAPLCEAIDISEHNVRAGAIDWAAVRASGVPAVMIRIGWAGYDGPIAGNNAIDDSFDASVRGAAAAGLDVGLYVYAYCRTPTAARIAARECVRIAQAYPGIITYPIAIDVEETGAKTGHCLTGQGKAGLASTIAAFCDEAAAGGYYAAWYTYAAFAASYIDTAALAAYDLWIANYAKDSETMAQWCGRDSYGMWQYAGDKDTYDLVRGHLRLPGGCPGVSGPCDRNRVYRDYPSIIRTAGLNGLTAGDPEKAAVTLTAQEYAVLRAKADKYDRIAAIAAE
ncbi:hypothetical protein CE91St46_03220 [Eubacteriales bacterium]|nr:hypothetical protein [Faecalicatena sp. BF-R-105]GKH49211.1 hypothetical protein CE91St46_03220 [Eubacteriales bacterium]GKH61852.1 hypothetical protein CE91St47_03210 [Eubacteriales bacterium]